MNLDFSEVRIHAVITHHISNPLHEQDALLLSDDLTQVEGETFEYFLKYLLTAFKPQDFYHFAHPVELARNDIFAISQQLFEDRTQFVSLSQSIAKLLHERSNHPKIKAGELNVVFFDDIILGDEMVEAIGIFKSESNVPFIKIQHNAAQYQIAHDFGFEIKKMDKGCLIFNIETEAGFRVLVVDNLNKQGDAQYWVEDFLQLKPLSDEFYQTKAILNLTKTFLTEHAAETLDKTEKIDLLNKTMTYFKEHTDFQKNDFEEVVFEDANLRQDFQRFQETAAEEGTFQSVESFEISTPAVKAQAKAFKSILKLDKNFHIYIHGDKSLIERGTEADGRKFYKLYFEEEA